jgi:hypothetical protein
MRTAELHAALEAIQRSEPRHRLVGSRDKKGNPMPVDEVCAGCPSRKKCKRASLMLADMENKIL